MSYAVSTLKEARKLRELTTKPILIFTPPTFFDVKKEDDFIFTVSDEEDCKYLSSLPFYVFAHLKINTGMNRFGVENAKELQYLCQNYKNIKYLGAYTHLFSREIATSKIQIDKFLSITPFIFNHITFKEGVEYKGLQKI